MKTYDIIVIGARCAGAATAMLLARKGCKVLLVDRATFPSNIPFGHFIHSHGPGRLQKWGLLERVVATGCPPCTSMTTVFDDTILTGKDLAIDGVALGYGPRRFALDKVLVDAAVEAGAELREGFNVEGFTTEGDRITGILGRRKSQDPAIKEHAAVVIGADGRNSRLAHAVQAPNYEEVPTLTCWFFSYWSGVAFNQLLMSVRNRHVIFAFPTNERMTAVFIAWPSADLPRVRANVEGEFMAALEDVPELAACVRAGRREERFYAMADLPNFLRKPYGPGWALVGDAGCHKDPFTALGICDAFRDSELLAGALADGLSGRSLLTEALAGYELQRNKATMPDYRKNIAYARFEPFPADIIQLRLALRVNQEDANRYHMAMEGMIPAETFFNPENLQRIMGVASPGQLAA